MFLYTLFIIKGKMQTNNPEIIFVIMPPPPLLIVPLLLFYPEMCESWKLRKSHKYPANNTLEKNTKEKQWKEKKFELFGCRRFLFFNKYSCI